MGQKTAVEVELEQKIAMLSQYLSLAREKTSKVAMNSTQPPQRMHSLNHWTFILIAIVHIDQYWPAHKFCINIIIACFPDRLTTAKVPTKAEGTLETSGTAAIP